MVPIKHLLIKEQPPFFLFLSIEKTLDVTPSTSQLSPLVSGQTSCFHKLRLESDPVLSNLGVYDDSWELSRDLFEAMWVKNHLWICLLLNGGLPGIHVWNWVSDGRITAAWSWLFVFLDNKFVNNLPLVRLTPTYLVSLGLQSEHPTGDIRQQIEPLVFLPQMVCPGKEVKSLQTA